MMLSVSRAQDPALEAQGARGAGGGPGHGLDGTEAPVCAVPASVSRGQGDGYMRAAAWARGR